MSIGYVVAIVVDGKPVLFWKEECDDDVRRERHELGTWTKNAQAASRSYDRDAITAKFVAAGNSTMLPGLTVVVVEERVVVSVMTELMFERRRLRRIKLEPLD